MLNNRYHKCTVNKYISTKKTFKNSIKWKPYEFEVSVVNDLGNVHDSKHFGEL